ncbi:MAG: cob(I)yrinic acid a,c-diamide adenosyltransferase [Sphaerochaetaceae bacterium]
MKAIQGSLILIYTGDGKGKTSAAMGQLVRALGHDARCAVAQFIKKEPELLDCGEYRVINQLGVPWKQFGCGFSWEGDNNTKNAELAKKGWQQIKRWISSASYDLIVLDEFTYTLSLGYLDSGEICTWLEDHKSKEGFPHLIITGRNAHPALLAIADMVSEIRQVKHHLAEANRKAQPMIEY